MTKPLPVQAAGIVGRTLHPVTRAELDKQPTDVRRMFDAVARRYDVTNDVLSLGQ
ncbi:MAG: demethylmenaquinone methyltransferase / 2-octaprenyl-6-methoxy,4-benzoquinone methylase, partial [Nocardioides sp.]|nr:demethylmenaquinone methyltransferase / 2-octaprenyl-6-methoxy,4-benzoquinone methylase [Nocardioides sp.]